MKESKIWNIYAIKDPLGKIEDVPDFKESLLLKIYEETHQEVVRFCQVYANVSFGANCFLLYKGDETGSAAMDDWSAGESSIMPLEI